MSRAGNVFYQDELAGIISENEDGYYFQYDEFYLRKDNSKAISLTIPLKKWHHLSRQKNNLRPGSLPRLSQLMNPGKSKLITIRSMRVRYLRHHRRLLYLKNWIWMSDPNLKIQRVNRPSSNWLRKSLPNPPKSKARNLRPIFKMQQSQTVSKMITALVCWISCPWFTT